MKATLCFCDTTVPDSFACVEHLCKSRGCDTVYVILTGRRLSFATIRYDPSTNQCTGSDGTTLEMNFSTLMIRESAGEKFNETDTNLNHGKRAADFQMLLMPQFENNSTLPVFDGGIAKKAGLSERIHQADDLFVWGRPVKGYYGGVVTPEVYNAHITTLYGMTEEERRQNRRFICKDSVALTPLDHLLSRLSRASEIEVIVAGPYTGLSKLMKLGTSWFNKVTSFKAQGFVWKGAQNLLGAAFNNQVDFEATQYVVSRISLFKNATITIVPTEVCKEGNWLDPDNFLEDNSTSRQLVELWTAINGGMKQPLFDMALCISEEMIPFQKIPVKLVLEDKADAFCGQWFKLVPDAESNIFAYITQEILASFNQKPMEMEMEY